jgi:hypothetical protein
MGEGGELDVRSNQRQGGPGGRAHRGSRNGCDGGSQSSGSVVLQWAAMYER